MNTMGIEKSNRKRVFTSLAVLMMVANVYVVPFLPTIGVGEAIFLLFFPYFFLGMKNRNMMSTSLFMFLTYSFTITIIMALARNGSLSAPLIRMVRDFVYIMIIFVFGGDYVERELLVKEIKLFCKILAYFIIIQCLVYYIFHFYVPGIPYSVMTGDGGLTGKGIADTCMSYVRNAGYLKPPGFLCEAAHCAQCLLIGVCICLFPSNSDEKIDLKNAVLFSVVALITMSAAAIIYIVAIWLFALLGSKGISINHKLSILAVLLIGSFVMLQSGVLVPIFERLSRLSELNIDSDNSTWFRISRGFNIWSTDLNLVQKVVGVGFGNIEGVLEIENEYMNSIAYLMVSAGIIGCILYIFLIARMVKLGDNRSKAIILALILMASCSSIYSSSIYVWGMLLIVASYKTRDYGSVVRVEYGE